MKGARALLAAAALSLVARTASAHVSGVSRGDYWPSGRGVRAEIVMKSDEVSLAGTTPAALVEATAMSDDGAACASRIDGVDPDGPDGTRVRATFTCAGTLSRLHVHFGMLDRLPAGHRHLATFHLTNGDVDFLALLATPDTDVRVGPPASHGVRSAVVVAAGVALLAGLTALGLHARRRWRS